MIKIPFSDVQIPVLLAEALNSVDAYLLSPHGFLGSASSGVMEGKGSTPTVNTQEAAAGGCTGDGSGNGDIGEGRRHEEAILQALTKALQMFTQAHGRLSNENPSGETAIAAPSGISGSQADGMHVSELKEAGGNVGVQGGGTSGETQGKGKAADPKQKDLAKGFDAGSKDTTRRSQGRDRSRSQERFRSADPMARSSSRGRCRSRSRSRSRSRGRGRGRGRRDDLRWSGGRSRSRTRSRGRARSDSRDRRGRTRRRSGSGSREASKRKRGDSRGQGHGKSKSPPSARKAPGGRVPAVKGLEGSAVAAKTLDAAGTRGPKSPGVASAWKESASTSGGRSNPLLSEAMGSGGEGKSFLAFSVGKGAPMVAPGPTTAARAAAAGGPAVAKGATGNGQPGATAFPQPGLAHHPTESHASETADRASEGQPQQLPKAGASRMSISLLLAQPKGTILKLQALKPMWPGSGGSGNGSGGSASGSAKPPSSPVISLSSAQAQRLIEMNQEAHAAGPATLATAAAAPVTNSSMASTGNVTNAAPAADPVMNGQPPSGNCILSFITKLVPIPFKISRTFLQRHACQRL